MNKTHLKVPIFYTSLLSSRNFLIQLVGLALVGSATTEEFCEDDEDNDWLLSLVLAVAVAVVVDADVSAAVVVLLLDADSLVDWVGCCVEFSLATIVLLLLLVVVWLLLLVVVLEVDVVVVDDSGSLWPLFDCCCWRCFRLRPTDGAVDVAVELDEFSTMPESFVVDESLVLSPQFSVVCCCDACCCSQVVSNVWSSFLSNWCFISG